MKVRSPSQIALTFRLARISIQQQKLIKKAFSHYLSFLSLTLTNMRAISDTFIYYASNQQCLQKLKIWLKILPQD